MKLNLTDDIIVSTVIEYMVDEKFKYNIVHRHLDCTNKQRCSVCVFYESDLITCNVSKYKDVLKEHLPEYFI